MENCEFYRFFKKFFCLRKGPDNFDGPAPVWYNSAIAPAGNRLAGAALHPSIPGWFGQEVCCTSCTVYPH